MEMKEIENRLSEEGKYYKNIPVPEGLEEKVNKAVRKAKRVHGFRVLATVAAAAVLTLVILPNTTASIAYAMGNIPIIGELFQVVTFRNYKYEDGRFNADVEIPQLVAKDIEPEEGTAGISEKLDETIKQVNFDIEKMTEQLVEEFEAAAGLGESYGDLEIHHEVVTDNERYFALKLFIYYGAGSGTQSSKIYTIDKLTGQQVQLADLFLEGSSYNELISENIRAQMRIRMAADGSRHYWVDQEEMPDLNWQGLKEEENFYFDKEGNLVIVFDEYEVAPGYMGIQEFTVEKAVYEELLR